MAKGFFGRIIQRIFRSKEVPVKESPPPPPPTEPPRSQQQRPAAPGRGRQYWQEQVINRKEEIWGDSGRYNPQRAARNVRTGIDRNNPNPPSLALLQWAATAPEDDLEIAIRSGDSQYAFLFYK